jgi:methionyl-tRNA formyltransferase
MKLVEPAVKQAAAALGIPVIQPATPNSAEFKNWMREQQSDVAIVLAYGRILPSDVLRMPKQGCINLHASLLPRYRGAAPINWALINGETKTGMSLMQMDEGLDTGPVYAMKSISIPSTMNAGELTHEMALLAATMVREDLPRALRGEIEAVAQDSSAASKAPPLEPEIARIDFERPADCVANLIRGLAPRPGAYSALEGKRARILEAAVAERESTGVAGMVTLANRTNIIVQTGKGSIRVLAAQLEGKKVLGAGDLVNGRVVREGQCFGQT